MEIQGKAILLQRRQNCSLSSGLNYCSVLQGDVIAQELNMRLNEPVGPNARKGREAHRWSIGGPIKL
jgi:hypothetical protein